MTDEELAAQAEAELQAAKEAEEAEKARAALKSEDNDDDKSKKKTSDEAAKLLKEVMALKAKLKEKDKAISEVNDKYKDIDLDAARDALRKAEEAETKELERKGEYERLLAKQKEKAEALLEAERNRIKEMEGKLTTAMQAVDELSLGNAFANSKFIQDKLALTPNKTRALYATHFEVEDGRLVAYDKPRGTPNRTPLINTAGESLSFDEAIEEIINSDPDKEYLLRVETRSGAGSKGSNVKADLETKKPMDSISKIAAGLKNPKNFAPDNIELK
jgi:hypothetical protein